MLFSQIIGQEEIKSRLIQSVKSGRISHAQLFCGPEGCGKMALALAFAQYICCLNRTDSDSCGVCSSCKKYMKLIHSDLHFVIPVARVRNISNPVSDHFINEFKPALIANPYMNLHQWMDIVGGGNSQFGIFATESEEIIKKLNFKSYESEFKIMIIWLPERMNDSSANKLLKMIEEPPDKTFFLLISEEPGQIISTILSRTQMLKIPQIENESLANYFRNNSEYSLSEGDLKFVVKLAKGNFNEAIKLINVNEENQKNLDLFRTLMRWTYGHNILEIIKLSDVFSGLGREKQKDFLAYGMRMIRENFIRNQTIQVNDELIYLNKDEDEFSKKFSTFITEKNVGPIFEEFNKASMHIERNAAGKIVFLDFSLKLAKLLRS